MWESSLKVTGHSKNLVEVRVVVEHLHFAEEETDVGDNFHFPHDRTGLIDVLFIDFRTNSALFLSFDAQAFL